jgi:hypothetical protein
MARRVLFAFGMCVAYSAVLFAQKVTSEFDDTLDFRKFKTFAVRDGQMNSPSPALNSELTKKRVQTAIERALTAKGLTKADGASDLNVFFTLGSRGVVEREEVPAGPRGLRTHVERVPAIEGNLVIGFRDPATRSVVWRGIASDDKANPIDISKKLDDWVKKIVDKYPPKK